MNRLRNLTLAALLLLFGSPLQASGLHATWGELLSRHVDSGVVDYQGFKQDEELLDSYLAQLERTDPEDLSENDQLALYINAYNSYTIKLILEHFENGKPLTSIKKVGGLFTNPWKIQFAKIGGTTYSLDNIEHDIIRPQFDEPRIHFAVNCASKSCPVLISEPYEGRTLDAQLEKSTRDFLMDPEHNRLDGDTLYISSIFKWYGEDFLDGPVAFFLAHTDGELRAKLAGLASAVRVKYLDYDWSLNGRND